ncbi:MAG: HD-GYP domain-containing protein [Anaerolineales bacterium]
MTTSQLSLMHETAPRNASKPQIDAIPLPFASVSFSDAYHLSLLENFGIDGGLVAFERPEKSFYISSALGLASSIPALESEVSCLCGLIEDNLIQANESMLSLRSLLTYLPTLKHTVDQSGYRFLYVFKINDFLATSGYWLLFFREYKNALRTGEMISHALFSPRLGESFVEQYDEIRREEALDKLILNWVSLLDKRDKETEEHTRRVANLAIQLGESFDLAQEDIQNIYRGALLHDIGKLVIPDKILLKPGPLSESEWKIMRLHPRIARDLLNHYEIPAEVLEIPYAHHERWDGGGYPNGLKGEEIPLSARIFSIVDVWDAMLVDRPYRKKFPRSEAIEYIREQAGRHFDPVVVEVFLEMVSPNNCERSNQTSEN